MALSMKTVPQLREPGRHFDKDGLYLQVISPTNRSWLLRYQRGGKERWMGLGPVDTFDLAEARERARKARQLLFDGIDPIEARRADRDKAAAEERANVTFKEAAEKYLDLHEETWKNAKHRQQWRNTLSTYAYPKLGTRPVKAIDAALINGALAHVWKDTPETGKRTKQRIERVLQWVTDGMPLPTAAAGKAARNHPALPFADLPAFMGELRAREGISPRALEFLILTAARTGEVIGATWAEIDFDHGVWTVPAARMKAGREHRVPLSERAVELLRALPREDGNEFVFIGGRRGRGLSNMALLELLRGMRPGFVPHGFRSSFSDWAHERTAYPNHVIEMALAHTIKNKVEAAYRRGDLLEKRVKLMGDWAKYCASVPGKVISLPRISDKSQADSSEKQGGLPST